MINDLIEFEEVNTQGHLLVQRISRYVYHESVLITGLATSIVLFAAVLKVKDIHI